MNATKMRRQNASCDPCRHSKKRCVLDPDTRPGSGVPCQNCARLGHICTFNFVTGRQAQKRQRSSSLRMSSFSVHQQASVDVPDSNTPLSSTNTNTSHEAIQPSAIVQEDYMDDITWVDLNPQDLDFFDLPGVWTDTLEPAKNGNSDIYENGTIDENTVTLVASPPLNFEESSTQDQVCHNRYNNDICFNSWHGRPTRLLNSTASNKQLTKQLFQVYDTMISSLTFRYLAHPCNQFPGSCEYGVGGKHLAEDDLSVNYKAHEQILSDVLSTPTQNDRSRHGNNSPQSSKNLSQYLQTMTMIGVSRFLDNFAPFYGNCLRAKSRALDEEAFKSAALAFALQFQCPDNHHLSEEDPLLNQTRPSVLQPGLSETSKSAFTTAWFHAHSNLTKSFHNRSFVRITAALIFHMVAVPEEGRAENRFSTSPVYFLKHALLQLQSLTVLVETFCSQLSSKSSYRTLLDSSLQFIRWSAYVCDTMSSVVSGSGCTLDDVTDSVLGTLH